MKLIFSYYQFHGTYRESYHNSFGTNSFGFHSYGGVRYICCHRKKNSKNLFEKYQFTAQFFNYLIFGVFSAVVFFT